MRNKILLLFIGLCANLLWGQTKDRPFPYRLVLTETYAPDEIEEHIGENAPTGSSRYTEYGLVLTEDQDEFAFSGFYLKDIEFPSNHGIIVEFKYAMYDGKQYFGTYGDGMSMFLFDGDKDFEIGAAGAGLGYAYNNGERTAGLNGAYLGIGLDVFGGFRERAVSSGEKREGIHGLSYKYDDHITLRGGQFKNDRYKGYPVLGTEQVAYGNEGSPGVARAILDYDTGDYETSTYSNPGGMNDLRTLKYDGWSPYYNTVTATLIPVNNGEDGMLVSVKVRQDRFYGYKNPFTDFYYPNSFKTRDQNGDVYTFQTKVPDVFKVGFAASTGGATQTQMIKEVIVDLPYAPITVDREVVLCSTSATYFENYAVIEGLLSNSTFYQGTIDDPNSRDGQYNADLSTLRFEDENGFDVTTSRRQDDLLMMIEYEEPGVGLWEMYYRPDVTFRPDVTLYFTPERNDLADGEYSVYYSAKAKEDGSGGPFAEDIYRSRPTKVTAIMKSCSTTVNPNLPIKVKMEEEEEEED